MKIAMMAASLVIAFFAAIQAHAAELSPQAKFALWKKMRSSARPGDPLNPSYVACIIGVNDYMDAARCNGGSWDAAYHCGIGPETIAETICNIHTPQGVISIPHDPPMLISNPDGGECGYTSFRITCHRPPGTQVLYDTHRPSSVMLGCGQSGDNAALALCQRIKPPTNKYGVFSVWDQAGGSCGFTAVDVICYK
jgi:hypothetical protein